jgi:hypothetical protein
MGRATANGSGGGKGNGQHTGNDPSRTGLQMLASNMFQCSSGPIEVEVKEATSSPFSVLDQQ